MMSTVLPWFNLGNAAASVGLAQAATEAAIGHAGQARMERLDQSLSPLPTIRAQLANGCPTGIGAVAYTANVVPIWEGIRDYFRDSPAEMDFVLFSNYGRQVDADALQAGHIDIAWNTNLAYVRTVLQTGGRARALAMRDTDTAFATVFVARPGSGLNGPRA